MNLPKQIPKRSGKKPIIIQIGSQSNDKRQLSPQQFKIRNSSNNTSIYFTNSSSCAKTPDKNVQNLNNSRRIHQISKSSQPVQKNSGKRLTEHKKTNLLIPKVETLETKSTQQQLHEMISELLKTKRQSYRIMNSIQKDKKSNQQKKFASQKISGIKQPKKQEVIIKRIQNKKYKKISTALPFTNLTLLFPDWWHYYQGQSINNTMHGHGTLYLTNGQKFTGKFENNKANGNGTFYKKNGAVVIGVWNNNEIIKRII